MEINKEISILQILKESLRSLKNKEILIATMTFVLVGTAIYTLYDPYNNFTIKKLIFYVLGEFILCIGEMIIIKIVEKKYKKEEVDVKNIIQELMPRSFSALALYLIVNTITILGTLALVIPGILFCVYSAFYLQVFTLENNGIEDSIKNSISLSKGFRNFIFGMVIISITMTLINDQALLRLLKHLFNSSISSGVNIIIASVIDSFTTIGFTSLYFKIKKIKTIE
ncbi:hypothetical protein Ccar_03790 [Clostridium carboxidivorans P7]|uniref:Uncharacterized protein n=1 Tax=Clostridium carboxidivorans P7 TaxID=536227 RepID=C6PYR4_9CLOT|nr:hypothetical protein [Clostridium carboxidivorans]AKN29996.1 hypothetical protein Ccar_03790 [Clostridium carboxidivorans P7]EET85595.1 hypothetical protein CcarbDRAFT_3931 [Clostridium carboxidivorans P7]